MSQETVVATLAKLRVTAPHTEVRLAIGADGGELVIGGEPWQGPVIVGVGHSLIVERTEHEVIVTLHRKKDAP